MSLFGPDPMWARPRPSSRWLLPALLGLAFAFAASLTPAASAQELVPVATGGEAAPPITEPSSSEPAQQADPVPVAVDPAPQPDPQPQPQPVPDPTPPPEAQAPAETPPTPIEEHPQTVPDKGGDGGHNEAPAQDVSPSFGPVTTITTFSAAPQAPVATIAPGEATPVTTAPLGWDVYDDALFAETLGDGGVAGGLDNALPQALRSWRTLSTIGTTAVRDKHHDAEPVSRADSMPAGGSGPGGSGPGQGASLGLFGAGGGSSAGIALLTLLGMACGWFLLAPDPMRAFLTSTATWRPSAYVPPIEHPG